MKLSKSSPFIEQFLKAFRKEISFMTDDRVMHDDMLITLRFLQTLELDSDVLFA